MKKKLKAIPKIFHMKNFSADSMISDAVTRNLEIIGETVKNIPADVKKRPSETEWKKIAGIRDIIIHEYFGVNLKIIWDIIINKIPELKISIKEIINEIK